MKILVTAVFFPPQNAVASQRPYVWAREWARAGHEVTVLTIGKDLTKGDLSIRPFDGFQVIETEPGAVITRLRARRRTSTATTTAMTGEKKKPGMAGGFRAWLRSRGFLSSVRLPDVFDFWIPQVRRTLRQRLSNSKFDLIVSTFGPPASLHAGYLAKRQNPSAKWILDFRDLWSENHVYPGIWPFTCLEKRIEAFYLARSNAVTTVSDALAASLRKKTSKPVAVFENGFDPEELKSLPQAELNERKVTFVYTGSLHPVHRNPATFFQALTRLTPEMRSQIEVIFAGPVETFVQDLIRQFSLEDAVRMVGSLGRAESLRLQASASVLLFFEKQHAAEQDGVLTGKLFEYLATGRPVWALGIDSTTTVGRLLESNRCGKAFGVDIEAIVSSLSQTLRDGATPSRNVELETDVIHRFDRRRIATRMLSQMLSWMKGELPS